MRRLPLPASLLALAAPFLVVPVLVALVFVAPACVASARAEVLRTATLGCTKPDDAAKASEIERRHDSAAAAALLASRACITFPKGVSVDVDERKPPLACVRLTGDLSCYWLAAALVDEHPGQRGGGGGGGRQGGGRHQR